MKKYDLLLRNICNRRFLHSYLIPITIILTTWMFAACGTTKTNGAMQNQKVEMIADKDSTEYSLIVLDAGFESYLATQPSASFHTQQYFENWNRQYVTEWNIRHRNPMYYGRFYETEINYDPMEDYGLELNYRLYYYFQFIKDRYGIVLIDRGR